MIKTLADLLPGVASKLALRVPGSAGAAGLEPSMDSLSIDLILEIPDFFLCRTFWIEATSVGRLASWWKTLRLRMMAYTRLEFPEWEMLRLHMVSWTTWRWWHHASSHHQTDTGWYCWRPPAGRRPGGGSGGQTGGTRMWRRPRGGGAACWPPPWTDPLGTVKLWLKKKKKEKVQQKCRHVIAGRHSSSPDRPPEGSTSVEILTVHYYCKQAVKEWVESLVSTADDFVKDLNSKT